jgi:hypothetical protein
VTAKVQKFHEFSHEKRYCRRQLILLYFYISFII